MAKIEDREQVFRYQIFYDEEEVRAPVEEPPRRLGVSAVAFNPRNATLF